jgi:16S rRNA (cytosine967-C5)-methyltransferase
LWQEKGGDFKEILLKEITGLGPQDRRLAWELAVGTVKKKGRLERFLPHLLHQQNPDPTLKAILLVSLFQLEEKKWPEHAAVNEAVLLARAFRLEKMAGVVNACLRKFLRQVPTLKFSGSADELAAAYSYPEWIIEEWLTLFGKEKTIRALAWGNGAPPIFLRLNRLKTSEAEFFEFLSKQKFEWEKSWRFEDFFKIRSTIPLKDFSLLKEGKGYIQDPSSSLAVRLLDPYANEKILDACAAPGGKAALIAEAGAEITAMEKSPRRMRTLQGNLKKLGVKTAKTLAADFLAYQFEQRFDKILLDVPCTGLGTVARHPELRWEKKKEDAARLGTQALSFLERAAGLLSSGGVIVYSTCTLTAEEDWKVIGRFLDAHPEFQRERAERWLSPEFCDKEGNAVVLPGECETDGVFACRLVKK